jgi:hypothetical protein
MSLVTQDGEVVGGGMLNAAVIAGTLFIMAAALWSPAVAPVLPAATHGQAVEQVVVVAHATHAS